MNLCNFIFLWFFSDHNRLVGSGTPPTTILQTTSRKIDTTPRATVSPKTTQRVILSHSIQNNNQHANDIAQNDRISTNKALTNANQVDRIANNGKIDSCLTGIGSAAKRVTTATKATSTIDVVDVNLIHANKGVAALGVLIQYLVDDVSITQSITHKPTLRYLLLHVFFLRAIQLMFFTVQDFPASRQKFACPPRFDHLLGHNFEPNCDRSILLIQVPIQ